MKGDKQDFDRRAEVKINIWKQCVVLIEHRSFECYSNEQLKGIFKGFFIVEIMTPHDF